MLNVALRAADMLKVFSHVLVRKYGSFQQQQDHTDNTLFSFR